MKLSITTLLCLCLCLTASIVFAQKDGFKYQGLARDASGSELNQQEISLRLSILQNNSGDCNGTMLYREKQMVTTNSIGLFWVTVGAPAQVLDGSFNEIDWTAGDFCLMVEMDPQGQENFIDLGRSPLTSVPFALVAKTVENADDADADPTNEIQSLSLDGTIVGISGGNTLDLAPLIPPGGSDDQELSLDGSELSIEGGNSVNLGFLGDDADSDPGNEIQTLSLTGTSVEISSGNSLDLAPILPPGGTDDQLLTLDGTDLTIEDGNMVDLISIVPEDVVNLADSLGFGIEQIREILTNLINNGSTDDQSLTLDGTDLTIEDGNMVDLISIVPEDVVNLADSLGFGIEQIREILTNLINNGSTDDQNLSLDGMNLTIENGNSIDLGTLNMGGGSDDQTLSLTGTNLSIEDGNMVDLSGLQDGVDDNDNDPVNELQTLSLSGNNLMISNRNSVTLPSSSSGFNLTGGNLEWASTGTNFKWDISNSLSLRASYSYDEGSGWSNNWKTGLRYSIDDKMYAQVNSMGHIGYNTDPEEIVRIRLAHENNLWGYSIENKSSSNPWLWFQYSDNDGANLGLAYDFQFVGAYDPSNGSYSTVSDAKLKSNVTQMKPILNSIMRLDAKSYSYKKDRSRKNQFGFIAQEVEKIFPELVTLPKNPGVGDSSYMMNYSLFGVLAIKAIQEQQKTILEQQEKIEAQQVEIEAIKAALKGAGIHVK